MSSINTPLLYSTSTHASRAPSSTSDARSRRALSLGMPRTSSSKSGSVMCLRSSRSPATSRIASLNFDAPLSSIHSSRPSSPDLVSLIDGGELCGGVTSGRGSTSHESRVVGVPGETASAGGGDGARFA